MGFLFLTIHPMRSLLLFRARPWALPLLTLLAAGPLAASAQTFYSNGGTVFVNTGGTLQVNGGLSQTGAALLRTTGTATVSGDVASAAAATLDLSTGTLNVSGNVAQQGPTAGTTGTLRLSGAAAQTLALAGGTLPNLTVDKPTGAATLSQPLQVRRVLTMAGATNLGLGGQALTLLSDATGTALAVNQGTGVVVGTATVQRYIDGSINAGPGYRHFSAPVTNTTVADLATAGFSPEVSQASVYNSSPTPGLTSPFPTVFGYDQSRLVSAANSNYSAFDKGFFVPAGLGAPLVSGQGYAVNLAGNQTVDFQGTLGTGDLTRNLSRNTGATAADAGWALVGNPYPAPLDWTQVATTDRPNLDAAFYVVQSTGQYAGGYRTFVNGQSTTAVNNPLIAAGQGFFVRVSQGQTSGSLVFKNGQRVADYATAQQVSFQRTSADPRPALRLELAGQGLADGWVTYAEAGATAAFDRAFDAGKLANSTGLNLSSETGADERLAIDGQAAFTAATVLPLAVGVPVAGAYTLAAASLANLPAGLDAYLRDTQTGQQTRLSQGTRYAFDVSATQATALVRGRFAVVFATAAPLSTVPALSAAEVSVYPNPAHGGFRVRVPGVVGAATVQVELRNVLGQSVRQLVAPLPVSGVSLPIEASQLASGVYLLRVSAGGSTLVKRVVLD